MADLFAEALGDIFADEDLTVSALYYLPGEPAGSPVRVILHRERSAVRLGGAGAVAGRTVAELPRSAVPRLVADARLELDGLGMFSCEQAPEQELAGAWQVYLRPLRVARA